MTTTLDRPSWTIPTQARNILVEVSIRGEAEAAGISSGAYKNFLGGTTYDGGERRMQLEVDGGTQNGAAAFL